MLNDFTLALASWAARGEQAFAVFYPLDQEDRLFLLAKGRYLGRGERGTVAVAHGVLLGRPELDAIRGRAHRLIPLIPDPDESQWRAEQLPVPGEIAETPPHPHPELEAFGDFLAWRRSPVRIAVNPSETAAMPLATFLEAIPTGIIDHSVSWCDTRQLPAIGAFDPGRCDVTWFAADAGEAGDVTHRVEGGTVSGKIDPAPPVWRIWRGLFDRSGDREEPLPPAVATLLDAARFRTGYHEGTPEKAIRQTLKGVVTPSLRLSDFWALLERLGQRAGGLERLDEREVAARGIVKAFDAIGPEDRQQMAKLLRQFLTRVRLPGGWDAARRIAVERGIVADLGADVAQLIRGEIDDPFAGSVVRALESDRFEAAALAELAKALARLGPEGAAWHLRLAPALFAATERARPASPARRGVMAFFRRLLDWTRSGSVLISMAVVDSAPSAARIAWTDPADAEALVDGRLEALRPELSRQAGTGLRAPDDPQWATAALAYSLIAEAKLGPGK